MGGVKMEWKEVRLESILALPSRNGLTKPSKIRGKGVKMIGMGELFANPIIYDIPMDRVPVTDKELFNSRIMPGDLLFARQSLTLEGAGKCCYVKEVKEKTVFESHLIRIRIDKTKADAEFIYYFFNSFIGKCLIQNLVTQVAAAGIRGSELVKLEITIPKELEDQHRIASILSSLDRKIELNNKINADLEKMAQAIFKNWFVDFEPFKDGKFVDSELGMIPEGWKVGRLDEIADVVGGSTPSKAKPEYYTQNGIAWLTPKDLSNHPAVYSSRGEIDITQEGYNSTSTKLMPKGAVLFTSRAPIGYISIAQNEICTNQGFKSLVPKKAGTFFLYCFLKYATPEIENKSTGSTFKEASGALIKSLQTIMPNQKIFEDFETIVSPLFTRIEYLETESSRLSALRDTLLPKLMSGELEVSE